MIEVPDVVISLFLFACLVLAFVDFGLPVFVRYGFVVAFVLVLCVIGLKALTVPAKERGNQK